MIEELLVRRICEQAGISQQAECTPTILQAVLDAKEGHLCSLIPLDLELPESLCSFGSDLNPYPTTPLVRQEHRLYLQKNWALESLVRIKVNELMGREMTELDKTRFSEDLLKIPALQEAQVKALYMGFQSYLAIFTGGPGTGKTYTAGCFIRLLANQSTREYKVAIAAPTGKAAAHLEAALRLQGPLPERLKCESATLHRLLKLQPGMQRLRSGTMIDADLVVVDEASMIDGSLFVHLLNAIGPKTRLLLLGDPNQLSPVEGGSFFPDLSDVFGQKLERSIRMGEGSLFALSQSVLEARLEEIPFESIEWETIIDRVVSVMPNPIYSKRPDPKSCLEEQKRFRILCSLRQTPFGIDALNKKLLERFSKIEGFLAIPILVIQNDSKNQLYNGTTGVLIESKAYFLIGDEIKVFPEALIPSYEPAFFLSVHKSQGSEFEEVLALFPPGSESFGKEALYTAITRAKKKITIWADRSTFEASLKTSGKRRSGLKNRL